MMNFNILQNFKSNEYDHIIFNGIPIRIGIKEHFNRYEIEAYSKRKFQYNFLDEPLDFYIYHNELTRVEKSYSFVLAFYRRISLSLELSFSSPVSYRYYPTNELVNFKHLNELFEKYYSSFQKLDTNNFEKKNTFKNKVFQIVFKFWLSGYGLAPNYTDYYIDEDQLSYLQNWEKTQYAKVARFLGFILSSENFSPVKKVPCMKQNTSLEDRELGKWNKLLNKFNTPIAQEFFDFAFNNLRNRINNSSIIEYNDNKGILIRESLGSITDGTWVQYSNSLLDLAYFLNSNGYFTIEICLNGGIEKVMTYEVSKLPRNSKQNIRIVCRSWLELYMKINNIQLNINRIIPLALKNAEKSFGKMIHYGSAQTLLQTLLDDNCGYFDDNNISDLRARRACLLQLATGQRASEICCLLYKCLHVDNMGITWLFIHKTKGNKSNKVVATPDIKKWIEELQEVAPSHKILISTSEYPYGDNLEVRRLLADQFDESPFTYDSMNKFLIRVQLKIWGDNHPNKKPFTTHDLRRIHALYMRLIGKSKDEIQDQLGHDNIDSQLPYLATKPLEHQKWFKKIQLEGVYTNITSKKSSNTIELNKIIDKSTELNSNKYSADKIIDLLSKISADVENFEIPKYNKTPLPTGFPLRIHSCNANLMVNCGHTELHCFGCKYYKPDLNTLEDHKVEIFRYMVLVLYQNKLVKKTKDLLEKEIVKVRSNDIKNLINNAFNQLFKKFNISNNEISLIEKELTQKSNAYIKKLFKINPNPSFIEAKEYLIEGSIGNG